MITKREVRLENIVSTEITLEQIQEIVFDFNFINQWFFLFLLQPKPLFSKIEATLIAELKKKFAGKEQKCENTPPGMRIHGPKPTLTITFPVNCSFAIYE